MEYLKNGMEMAISIGDNKGWGVALSTLSYVNNQHHKHRLAISYGTKSVEHARKFGNVKILEESTKILFESYKALGFTKKALEMFELHVQMKDSVQSEEKKNEFIRLEYKYAYEKQATSDSIAFSRQQEIKDLEISEQKAQIDSNRFLLLALASTIILGGLLAVVLYRSYKRKLKAYSIIKRQKNEVEKQRDQIKKQHALLEDKNNEILEFNQNLERLVEKRTEELQKTLAKLRGHQFDLAHKIRVPIASLLGMLDLVKNNPSDIEVNLMSLAMVEDSSKKIDVIIHEITNELHEAGKISDHKSKV